MDKVINNIKLYVKETKKAKETEDIINKVLLSNGIKIDNNNFDLVVSVGGDGTFLKMLRNHNFDSNYFNTNASFEPNYTISNQYMILAKLFHQDRRCLLLFCPSEKS